MDVRNLVLMISLYPAAFCSLPKAYGKFAILGPGPAYRTRRPADTTLASYHGVYGQPRRPRPKLYQLKISTSPCFNIL